MQKNPPICIISTIDFHLTHVEMTMATAYQWLLRKVPKIEEVLTSYLDLGLSSLVKAFAFYLVTQPLSICLQEKVGPRVKKRRPKRFLPPYVYSLPCIRCRRSSCSRRTPRPSCSRMCILEQGLRGQGNEIFYPCSLILNYFHFHRANSYMHCKVVGGGGGEGKIER